MGLLDDAIREHMELKRLRGADPGEVARQERDALGPVVGEHDDPEGQDFEDGEHEDGHEDDQGGMGVGVVPSPAHSGQDDLGHAEPRHGDGEFAGTLQPERGPDFANVGQETAELDMRTVLDAQLDEDALEHEHEPAILGEAPGQERLWFDQQQQAPRDFDFDP